jgi:hypothetical protein
VLIGGEINKENVAYIFMCIYTMEYYSAMKRKFCHLSKMDGTGGHNIK